MEFPHCAPSAALSQLFKSEAKRKDHWLLRTKREIEGNKKQGGRGGVDKKRKNSSCHLLPDYLTTLPTHHFTVSFTSLNSLHKKRSKSLFMNKTKSISWLKKMKTVIIVLQSTPLLTLHFYDDQYEQGAESSVTTGRHQTTKITTKSHQWPLLLADVFFTAVT